jgi:ParB-like chromosome segregation protein Spo0J
MDAEGIWATFGHQLAHLSHQFVFFVQRKRQVKLWEEKEKNIELEQKVKAVAVREKARKLSDEELFFLLKPNPHKLNLLASLGVSQF